MKKIILGLILLSLAFNCHSDIITTCRNPAVKRSFDRLNGFPQGRKGYVVDHICALANGGLDITANMQYQTIADAKVKDRIENTKLGRDIYCNEVNSLKYRTVFNCK